MQKPSMVLFHHLKDCDSYFKVKAILLYKYLRTIIPHLDKQNAPPAIYLSLETLFNKYQPSFDISVKLNSLFDT